ncbi:hypothetical protein [Pseudovibrio sp. Ad26]|uniref:hypothetical protein n=1 Tax=Pseudovibrio sp. Ad26 TaxID=989410 RepID=UPI0007AEC93A|nr:hypothetical protein [Pseudovibrio sp. Ad26]KZL03584.1 hypothetical protein PsAD26_04660 [Pseudovibrio sp. Ad26]
MKITNRERLAQDGFVLIRGLLDQRIEGGNVMAFDVAEALHNIPCGQNDFTEKMTAERLIELGEKYPEHKQLQRLLGWIATDL